MSANQALSFDQIMEEVPAECMLRTTLKDENLTNQEAVFEFNCNGIYNNSSARTIRYSIDGKEYKQKLKNNLSLTIKTKPGKHAFMFYYNSDYSEIITDSLIIQPGFRDAYDLYFHESIGVEMVEKPVIYLYPEQNQITSVKLDVKGELAFTYPNYIDGWEFEASPNGDLTFGDNTYNYLFWESTQRVTLQAKDYRNGFNVPGADALSFLEDKLSEAGLTSQEKADFITYWGPRLAQNELNFVHFEFNEACDKFAELEIVPNPDHVYRIYMIWMPLDREIVIKEQLIPQVNREGFTVLEWGGQEVPPINLIVN